jgi:hypothetical protein
MLDKTLNNLRKTKSGYFNISKQPSHISILKKELLLEFKGRLIKIVGNKKNYTVFLIIDGGEYNRKVIGFRYNEYILHY